MRRGCGLYPGRSPAIERVLTGGYGRALFVIPVSGGEPRRFEGFPASDVVDAIGFSPGGRLVAAASMISDGQAALRVWDLETGAVQLFEQPKDPEALEGYYAMDLSFVDEATLYTSGANGLLHWDIGAGTFERIRRAPPGGMLRMQMASDRRKMMIYEGGLSGAVGRAWLHDLETGEVRLLDIPGTIWTQTFSPDGTVWASGEEDGSIWVGRTDGGEPHVLLGPQGAAWASISPDLKWIASSSLEDKSLRLWPMPDLSKPPLHALPHDELIAKLKTLTNIRVVRDAESSTGWKVEVGPFPGWAEVPEW